jgi:hypothetical protein
LPAGLGEICRGMMAKYPSARYPTPQAVGDALRLFAEANDSGGLVLDLEEGLEDLDPGQDTVILPSLPPDGATESE